MRLRHAQPGTPSRSSIIGGPDSQIPAAQHVRAESHDHDLRHAERWGSHEMQGTCPARVRVAPWAANSKGPAPPFPKDPGGKDFQSGPIDWPPFPEEHVDREVVIPYLVPYLTE